MQMGAKFTFRFETLWKLRARRADEAKRRVAARLRAILDLEERQRRLEDQVGQESRAVRERLTAGSLNVDDLRLARHWLVRLRQGVLQTEAEIAGQKANLAQERAALAAARKGARILENLRDRQYSSFTAQLQREEQRELDEMSVTRFAHAQLREEPGNP